MNMSLMNIFVFSIATCAYVGVIAGLFWGVERLVGAQDRPVEAKHLPIDHPGD